MPFDKIVKRRGAGGPLSPAFAARFAGELVDCELAPLGSGLHYLQEDHPDEIGRCVAGWIAKCERRATRVEPAMEDA